MGWEVSESRYGPDRGDENWLAGFLVRLLVAALGLAVAAFLLPGIEIDTWQALAVTALIFGLVNAFVRPVLFWLTCPLQILTLGLFTLVLNAAMLGLTAWIAGQLDVGFRVEGFWSALFGAIIISLVSIVAGALIGSRR
ncbi:MAG TPA: phage holin family protein [Dehalococcoidia bacterium]